MKNKNKYLLVIGIMLFAFIVIGVTYAIYRPNVTKINDTETVIKTNELGLVYTGPESLSCSNMIPGDKCIKHFTVENTSNVAVMYNIYMEQITNEFNEDLVYTLTDNNGNVVGETPLPSTNGDKSYLKTGLVINNSETKNYTITIEFKYSETENQSDYMGAEFKATIGIDTNQGDIFKISGKVKKKETGETEYTLINGGTLVFFSEKKDVKISTNGRFEVENLETGNHTVYYMGNTNPADIANMERNDVESTARSIGCSPVTIEVTNDISKVMNYSKTINFDCEGMSLKLDEVSREPIIKTKNNTICKVATSLHSDGAGGQYGTLFNGDELQSGNAIDCNVDGTGYKRFYYLRNMDENTAALIYSMDVGESSYCILPAGSNPPGMNSDGPVEGMKQLPTAQDWPNITIRNLTSNVKNMYGTIVKSNYTYDGYVARFLNSDDIKAACNVTIGSNNTNELQTCSYLFENADDYYYIEDIGSSSQIAAPALTINKANKSVSTPGSEGCMSVQGIRPVIHVPLSEISLPQLGDKEIALGDYVKMTPDLNEFQLTRQETGYYPYFPEDSGASNEPSEYQKFHPSQLNTWRVLNIKNDGTIELIAADVTTEPLYFYGVDGYAKSVSTLNYISSKYENSNYTIGSRAFGYNGQTQTITDTSSLTARHSNMQWYNIPGYDYLYQNPIYESLGIGDESYTKDVELANTALGTIMAESNKTYWVASRKFLYHGGNNWDADIRTSKGINDASLTKGQPIFYNDNGTINERGVFETIPVTYVRPIVILKSGLSFKGRGTKKNPHIIVGDTHQY